ARGEQFWSTNCSMDELNDMRRKLSGPFLWFRRGGDAYVIRDPATLEAARSLFKPLDALEPEQAEQREREEKLEEMERALDDEEEAIDHISDRLSDADEDGPKLRTVEWRDLEQRRQALATRQRALSDLQRREDQRERSLDEREEAIERKAEAAL